MLMWTGAIFFLKSMIDEASFADEELMTNFFQGSVQVWLHEEFHVANGKILFLNFQVVSLSLWASKPTHGPALVKAGVALLSPRFGVAQLLKRACGRLCSWKSVARRIPLSVSIKCRPYGIMQKWKHKFLHTTSIAVSDQAARLLGCYLLHWRAPEKVSCAIRDVLSRLHQSWNLKMPGRVIFSCVCVFSLQVLSFQGEKCSAWANMTNNCEMFICKQTSVGSTESKAESITFEKCYGIWGFMFSLQA